MLSSSIGSLLIFLLPEVATHVVWMNPPARQNIGALRPQCKLPINTDATNVFCGGFAVQHNAVNRGRCGICGDEFSAASKPHEAGGQYATGTLAASYRPGQRIEVTINVVASHKGIFTFALCPHNDPSTSPSPACFQRYKLRVNGGTYFEPTPENGVKKMTVQLPPGLTCSHCILQMTYTTGHNWGVGPQSAEVQTEKCLRDRVGKIGCGQQETFRGCADICIGNSCPTDPCAKATRGPPPPTTAAVTPPAAVTTATPVVTRAPPTVTMAPSHVHAMSPPAAATPGPPHVHPMPAAAAAAVCLSAGIKQQFFSMMGDSYCKYHCLNKWHGACMAGPNTAYLCYCNTTRAG
jgi:Lytic polysaccharide mono-oxygenase, cellulose-degrading